MGLARITPATQQEITGLVEAPALAGLLADGDAAVGGEEAEAWEACFLSSTSRLVLPVDEIEWTRADGSRARRTFAPHPLVARIEASVAAEVASHCSDVLGDE